MTEANEKRLARIIEAYWEKRGHKVKTHLSVIGLDPEQKRKILGGAKNNVYGVRSNMKNGLPRAAYIAAQTPSPLVR